MSPFIWCQSMREKLPVAGTVSGRNSVREALRILEDRGLIYVKTGSGVFINNPYGEHNSLTIQLTNCTLTEMEELQNALDHEAVKNAIEQMINKIRSYRFIQQEDSRMEMIPSGLLRFRSIWHWHRLLKIVNWQPRFRRSMRSMSMDSKLQENK